MEYGQLVEKIAREIVEEAVLEKQANSNLPARYTQVGQYDRLAAAKHKAKQLAKNPKALAAAGVGAAALAGGAVAANKIKNRKAQEKAAEYLEEVELMKKAAMEVLAEAQMIEDAAIEVLAETGYFDEFEDQE